MEKRSQWYQTLLILSLLGVAALIGIFTYREMFPEYKIYQNAYLELEEFRSSYTGEPLPPFRGGVKQLVLARSDKGPETIDRCISCHVALDLEHFSPTVVSRDVNGNVQVDEKGRAVLVENPNYVWKKLDDKIALLRKEGKESEASRLQSLKSVEVGHHHYDMTKVLAMHPLIGNETRPFSLHSMEDTGCTACHGGNGRGLVTDRAHGPVFDGDYHAEAHGDVPQFIEKDPQNDPLFASVFNAKPGHRLLFQTNPILVGGLIEANCMQCHTSTKRQMGAAQGRLQHLREQKEQQIQEVQASIVSDTQALASLVSMHTALQSSSVQQLRNQLSEKLQDYRLNDEEKNVIASQIDYLQGDQKQLLSQIEQDTTRILGQENEAQKLLRTSDATLRSVESFLAELQKEEGVGSQGLLAKFATVKEYNAVKQRLTNLEGSVLGLSDDQMLLESLSGELDAATHHFQRGQDLFVSQACYACHRIAGISRGGIGPELTEEGNAYPWFIKESITWPQADLQTSTMPNFRLDHEEVEDLVTYLLAQKGKSRAVADFDRKSEIASWEAGAKTAIEEPLSPDKIYDVSNSMKIYATEGCAACHRLKGFTSEVGYQVEKQGGDWEAVYQASQRFQALFPEDIIGSELAVRVQENGDEIDQLISQNAREASILEELEAVDPDAVLAFYSNFKYALRRRNQEFIDRIAESPEQRDVIEKEKEIYQDRIRKVCKMFVQEYGLGRLIGPRLNWSGVYRDDEWLIAHFRNPAAHSPKSLMPVMPYDDSKFYALTHMLNVLGMKNRDQVRKIWENKGFSPEQAFSIHCANCHGKYLHGNGPTAEWIYPIPKNLRNAYFLRNLTEEKAINSIVHGVKGGPMPPWGEVPEGKEGAPVLTEQETKELVQWLFTSLPGSHVIQDGEVLKWNYSADDVLEELDQAGESLQSAEEDGTKPVSATDPMLKNLLARFLTIDPDKCFVDRNPNPYQGKKELPRKAVEDVFTVVPSDEGNKYYIKKMYYTPENIRAGQALFSLHCSVCHGDEGAGNGLRAESMVDAKPRMLTNLDWLHTRDDLRLIRSIKYGVRGTSMTPWGDYTSSLQRLQLVIFIRSLTAEKQLRDSIDTALYQSFEEAVLEIAKVRSEENKALAEARLQYDQAVEKRKRAYEKVQLSQQQATKAVQSYEFELSTLSVVQQREVIDQVLSDLLAAVQQELQIYRGIGVNLIERGADDEMAELFITMIKEKKNRYSGENGVLTFQTTPKNASSFAVEKVLLEKIDTEIQSLKREEKQLKAHLRSGERDEKIEGVSQRIKGMDALKHKIISGLKDANLLEQEQYDLYQKYQNLAGKQPRGRSTKDRIARMSEPSIEETIWDFEESTRP